MSELELLKNINEIDDDLIFEAEQWKRPKSRKIKIAIVAAAAAVTGALLAVTGAAAIHRGNNEKPAEIPVAENTVAENTVQVGDEKFDLDLEAKGIIIPEEYRTTDEDGNPWYYERMRGVLPSELFAQFGVSPLLNDNFSEIIEFEPNHIYMRKPNGEEELVDVDYGDPVLTIDWCSIIFEYRLYNKISQRNITLQATYALDDDYSIGVGIGVDDDSEFEIIELNDGSMCYLDMGGAFFSYEGVYYSLNMHDKKENINERSIELTKQTLEALGVL